MSVNGGWELQGAVLFGLSRKDWRGVEEGKVENKGRRKTRDEVVPEMAIATEQDTSGCIPCSSLIFSGLRHKAVSMTQTLCRKLLSCIHYLCKEVRGCLVGLLNHFFHLFLTQL